EREFSDDEQEQEFRAQRKLERKRNAKHNDADDEEDGQVVDDAESFLNQRQNNDSARNNRSTRGSDRGNRGGRGARGGRDTSDAFSRGGGGRGGFHASGPRQYAHDLPSRGNRGGYESHIPSIRRNSSDHNRNHETPPNQNGYENLPRPISAPSNAYQRQTPSAPIHHSLPPKPQSAATQLPQRPTEAPIPGLPAMITQQQMLALMQQQQIQLQRQHQQQLQLATAAMARGLPVHPGIMMMQSPLYGTGGAPSHAVADPMGNTSSQFSTSATGTMNNLRDVQMGEQ
ncbi:hypothetical protein HDU80_011554, partial [Chytriomyces hyalinus]